MSDKEPFLKEMGERLASFREAKGLSLQQLADRTGLSKTGLWEIEQGRSEPRAGTLWRLSRALGVSIDDIVVQPAESLPWKDWRIGLSVKPKYHNHPMYYEPPGKVLSVNPSGTAGIACKDGVLQITFPSGLTKLVPADEWVTA